MDAPKSPKGLIIDLITPLDKVGGIDGRGLGKHLDLLISHAQALLLASPYAGEGQYLARELMEELLEKSLVVVQGRIPVLIWISGETEEKTRINLISLKKILVKRRYNGPIIWVDTPLFYHSNRGLYKFYRDISSITQHPIILHNDPELIRQLPKPLKRNNIRTRILKELILIDNLQGLIYAGPLERFYNYGRAIKWRRDFRLYDGDESRFLRHPSLSGVVSAGSNLVPRVWQKITSASLSMDNDKYKYPDSLKQVWEMGSFLEKIKNIYHKNAAPIIKQYLSDTGVIESPRSALEPDDIEGAVTRLKELMKQFP